MARNIKWRIQFKAITNVGCLINIYEENYTSGAAVGLTGDNVPLSITESGVTMLTPADRPFFYEEDNSDNLLDFVRIKTGYISVMEESFGELDDLEPISPNQHFVEAFYGSKRVFVGYMQPQTFENAYTAPPTERSFPIMSAVGLAETLRFVPPSTPGITTLGALLQEVMDGLCAGFANVVYPRYNTYAPWNNVIYSTAMCPYADNPDLRQLPPVIFEGRTYREFLDGLCSCFGWTLHEDGTDLVFVDMGKGNANGYSKVPRAGLTSLTGISDFFFPHMTYNWSRWFSPVDNDSTISIVRPLKKIEMTLPDPVTWPSTGDVFDLCRSLDSEWEQWSNGGTKYSEIDVFQSYHPMFSSNQNSTPQWLMDGAINNNCVFPARIGTSSDGITMSRQKTWLMGFVGAGGTHSLSMKVNLVPESGSIVLHIKVGYSDTGKVIDMKSSGFGQILGRLYINSGSKSYDIQYQRWYGTSNLSNSVIIDGSTGAVTPNFHFGQIFGYADGLDGLVLQNFTNNNGVTFVDEFNKPVEFRLEFDDDSGLASRSLVSVDMSVSGLSDGAEFYQYSPAKGGKITLRGNGLIEEDSIDITLNNYGINHDPYTIGDASYKIPMSTNAWPKYPHLLNAPLKMLRREGFPTGTAMPHSQYAMLCYMTGINGLWRVLSDDFDLRDGRHKLTYIYSPEVQ